LLRAGCAGHPAKGLTFIQALVDVADSLWATCSTSASSAREVKR
jgi:hypothetical protein